MNATQLELIDGPADPLAGQPQDNVTDEVLRLCREHYKNSRITKDDVWHYMYGVMHAPDWREKYKHDLQKKAPRLPLAPDFWAFARAGAELMRLHADYDTVEEHRGVRVLIDGKPDDGSNPDVYRIGSRKMWFSEGGTVMHINDRCRLEGIPAEAHQYTISGRSPRCSGQPTH